MSPCCVYHVRITLVRVQSPCGVCPVRVTRVRVQSPCFFCTVRGFFSPPLINCERKFSCCLMRLLLLLILYILTFLRNYILFHIVEVLLMLLMSQAKEIVHIISFASHLAYHRHLTIYSGEVACNANLVSLCYIQRTRQHSILALCRKQHFVHALLTLPSISPWCH
jgi:hypothetical protein